MNTELLLYLITERDRIHQKKTAGDPPPLTDDPHLREWSFCNVHREDDRTTRWLAAHWRGPNAHEPDLWFAMCVARFVNLPPTLAEIGFPVPWDPDHFRAVMTARDERGEKCYSPAYQLGTAGQKIDKLTYHTEHVFAPLWRERAGLRPRSGQTLAAWHEQLASCDGMGGFMAAQVVADMKYVAPLCDAPDWWTFAASGPGSRRGLNRVLGRAVDADWREADWRSRLRQLHEAIAPELERIAIGRLHAQDLQNCLCEFDKYMRVKNGEGKPKRRYRPSDEPMPVANANSVSVVNGIYALGEGAAVNITADLEQIARFVDALFPYAADGTIVLLRAFSGDEPWRKELWRPVRLGPDRTPLVDAAALLATQAANAETPVTFCPPVATFKGYRANADNLADALVLSVECDARPYEARSKLEDLLGTPTVIVASGGEWINPATGEVQDKLHLHWRLSVPARTPEEHADLKRARRLAQMIAGADATGVPPVHPLRWPGSWHRKGTPRLARIVGGDPGRETVLSEALMILRDVIGEIVEAEHQPGEPQAPIEQLGAAMLMLPNADKSWEEWNRIGMALYASTGGSEQGLGLFQHWSAKSSTKYNEGTTRARWQHYHSSPPTRIGAGTIFHLAAVEWVEPDFPDPDDWDPVWPEEITPKPNGAASAPTQSNSAATQIVKPNGTAHPHNEDASEGTASAPDAVVAAPLTPKPNGACTPTPATPPEPDWPALIDITATGNRVPPFPTALLPQPFRNFVEDIADRLQVPPCFPAIPTVISVATVLGRGVRLQPKRHDYKWTERACLWGVLISKVSARKTPATSEALAPICKIQSELMERYRAELDLWKLNEGGDKPVPERLLTNDSTVETLCRLMTTEHNANPRGLLLYRDELSGWLASMNQYKPGGQGADRQFYLQCWSGGQHIADRVTETRYVDDAYLNIFGSIQPDIVATSFRGGEKDGMTARIGLGAYPDMPDETAWVDRKPNTDAVDRVVDRLVGLRGLEGRLVKFDGPAYSIFEGWSLRNANRVELRDDTSFATHVAKYPALFARLALVLHFMKHGPGAPSEVAQETAEAARKLVDDYFEPHARKIYGVLEADPAKPGAVKIAEWNSRKSRWRPAPGRRPPRGIIGSNREFRHSRPAAPCACWLLLDPHPTHGFEVFAGGDDGHFLTTPAAGRLGVR